MRDREVNAFLSGTDANDHVSELLRAARAAFATPAQPPISPHLECCQDRKLLRSTAGYENGEVEECDVG
jgi:hypothetical protein